MRTTSHLRNTFTVNGEDEELIWYLPMDSPHNYQKIDKIIKISMSLHYSSFGHHGSIENTWSLPRKWYHWAPHEVKSHNRRTSRSAKQATTSITTTAAISQHGIKEIPRISMSLMIRSLKRPKTNPEKVL